MVSINARCDLFFLINYLFFLTMRTPHRSWMLLVFLLFPHPRLSPALFFPSSVNAPWLFYLQLPCILHHKQKYQNSNKCPRVQQDAQINTARCLDPMLERAILSLTLIWINLGKCHVPEQTLHSISGGEKYCQPDSLEKCRECRFSGNL